MTISMATSASEIRSLATETAIARSRATANNAYISRFTESARKAHEALARDAGSRDAFNTFLRSSVEMAEEALQRSRARGEEAEQARKQLEKLTDRPSRGRALLNVRDMERESLKAYREHVSALARRPVLAARQEENMKGGSSIVFLDLEPFTPFCFYT